MSKKVNEALYDLIQSMTKSEKRYFKLMSSRHTIGDENKYILLFDYLDCISEYCEKSLFDHFKGEAFLNRFSITKKRLYDHLLLSLDSFHLTNSIEAQLYKQLHSADILFEKSLYDQCRRMLISAEKAARKNNLTEILLLIERKRQKLIETSGYLDTEADILEDSKQNFSELIGNINAQHKIWITKSKLFAQMNKKGVARSPEEVELYNTLASDLLSLRNEDLSADNEFLLNHTLSAFYFAKGELENSLDCIQKNILLIEDGNQNTKIEVNRYVSLLTNAIYITDKLGNSKESMRFIQQLKGLAQNSSINEDLSIKLFSSISSIEISMMLRKGDFAKALKYSVQTEEQLRRFEDKLTPSRKAYIEFKLAVIHLGCGNYSESLRWVNSILNDSRLDQTEDIVGFTQLLDLLIHIELNNDKLLPYSLKSVQRYFKTRNRMYSFERVFLQFISKLIKCDDRFEAELVWKSLYDELSKITNEDAFESIALEYFDFQSWAKHKLSNRSFDSIVREKYNQQLIAC